MKTNRCPAAVVCIRGDEDHPNLRGRAELVPCCGGTMVNIGVRGLPESATGFFALHIHEGETCGGAAFSRTGGHFNPKGEAHPRHAGDLPPLLSCCGRAYLSVYTSRFRPEDVIGKTLVIHSGPDDFKTQPAGDAGNKIACGMIRRPRQTGD